MGLDIAVIGAGIVGVCCAAYLRRDGHRVTVLDPVRRWVYDPAKGWSKSRNSPWAGRELVGRVIATVVAGRLVFHADRGVLVP